MRRLVLVSTALLALAVGLGRVPPALAGQASGGRYAVWPQS